MKITIVVIEGDPVAFASEEQAIRYAKSGEYYGMKEGLFELSEGFGRRFISYRPNKDAIQQEIGWLQADVNVEGAPGEARPSGIDYNFLAEKVMEHANKHYSRHGWDFVVETKTIDELAEMLRQGKRRTFRGSVDYIRDWAMAQDEQRQSVMNEAF